MLSPLAQDSGDDAQASTPTPRTAPNPQGATAGLVPGQSLGFVKIGEARADVIAAIKMRPTANYDLKHGLVEDEWSGTSTDGSGDYHSSMVWYRQGKVVQVQTTIAEQQKRNAPSFNTLIARDPGLKAICYGMSYYDPSGETRGGADFYCFDDVKRGIAFGIGVNGDAYMTNKPDTVIIHVVGVPYIPFQGLTNVSLVTGAGAVLYQNQTEQDRAFALEKKKSSRAGAYKKR